MNKSDFKTTCAILTLALTLAACGDSSAEPGMGDGGASVTLADGTKVAAATSAAGLAPPANLPAFAPVYPGATIDNVTLNDRAPHKGILSFTAKATVEDVARFYKQQGQQSGLELKQDVESSGSQTIMLAKPGNPGEDIGVQVSIGPSMQGQGQVVTVLTYAGPQ